MLEREHFFRISMVDKILFLQMNFSGNDSFIAFEEILYYAKYHQVDFILLGGDLFHDTNPSKEALNKYDITTQYQPVILFDIIMKMNCVSILKLIKQMFGAIASIHIG